MTMVKVVPGQTWGKDRLRSVIKFRFLQLQLDQKERAKEYTKMRLGRISTNNKFMTDTPTMKRVTSSKTFAYSDRATGALNIPAHPQGHSFLRLS
jgi:hypothetical protein